MMGLASRVLIAAVLVSVLVGQAEAKIVYIADPLTKGDLAQWSIYSFLFLAQAVLGAIALVKMRGRRLIFSIILLSALMSVVGCVAGIVLNVMSNNIAAFPSFETISDLNTILDFFSYWTDPLLFLPIVLILVDRHTAIVAASEGRMGGLSRVYTIINYSWFAFLVLLATIDGSLLAVYEHLIFSDTATIGDVNRAATNANNVNYVLDAFWYASALYAAFLGFVIHRDFRRAGVSDKVSKTVIWVVIPCYILLMVDSIIFQIMFSPSGIQQTIRNLHQIQQASLASEVIVNFFYWSTAMVMVVLGLRPAMWGVQGATPPDSPLKLKTWSFQSKDVLPKLKKQDIGQNFTGFESNIHLNPGSDRNAQV